MAGSGSKLKKVACAVLLAVLVVVGLQAEAAVTCGLVATSLAPCMGYLVKGGPVTVPCCNGVKFLHNSASTTVARQTICKCIQEAAGSVTGINPSNAIALPGKCGITIPYKTGQKIDCSKIKY